MSLAARSDVLRFARISNKLWLLLAAVICASVNERAALVAGIFLVSHVILYWQQAGYDRRYRLILGAGLFGYGYAVLKVLQITNPDYSTFFRMSKLLELFGQPQFDQAILMFVVVNLPLWILALFEWRAATIAAILMLPNIFGNVGGAEKIGWSMHYPSFFLPSLIWAGSRGCISLCAKLTDTKRRVGAFAGMAGSIVFLTLLNPYSTPISLRFENTNQYSFIPRLATYFDIFYAKSVNREALQSQADEIIRIIPPHSIVSSVESGTGLLYKDRTIAFYPADLDNADYAVLSASLVDGKLQYGGALTYQGAVAQGQLNDLALARMKHDGYDVDHPMLFPAYRSLAIIKRIH